MNMSDAFVPVVREVINRSEIDQVVVVLYDYDARDIRDVDLLRFDEFDAFRARIGMPALVPADEHGQLVPFEPLAGGKRWVIELTPDKPVVIKQACVTGTGARRNFT
jgi:hypothetical protein